MKYTVYQKPDLHMHSIYSDGSDTPEELIQNVRNAGIDVFALTDHDTYDGCAAVRKLLRRGDPYFIGGVELSCKDELGKYHILGYCYDVNKPSIREAVELTHNARMVKTKNRFSYLQKNFGFTFSEGEITQTLALKNPGKPHFAMMMMEKGYVAEKAEAFRILAGYHGNEPHLTPMQAIDSILRADGIPVLAHGILADGTKKLTEEAITQRVSCLKNMGLMGLECYYSSFTPLQKKIMLSLAERYNLLVTAGSDYHGANKTVRLGDTNEPEQGKMSRFYAAVAQLLE